MKHSNRLANAEPALRAEQFSFRQPEPTDGAAIWELVRQSGGLDENSMYCNLLQCSHFANTCCLAEHDGEYLGWVSGYIPPQEPDTLFVWQVCVSKQARGFGLASDMITKILQRDVCRPVGKLKTTITKDNQASWSAFEKFAERQHAQLNHKPHFETEHHFDGQHETEHMLTIAPLMRTAANDRSAHLPAAE